MTTFERIKKLAKKRHLTLVEVNDRANLGTRTIYHWKDKQPSNNNLAAVAKVLNTTTDYLTGLTDNPSPSNNERPKVDLADDDTIFTYEGRPIPPEDLQIIKRLLNSDNDK